MKIGLLGFGTVGSGVYEILSSKKMREQNIFSSVALVRDTERYQKKYGNSIRFVSDANEILDDQEIDLIVEVMGGIDKPFEYLSLALQKRKHVVTANKAVLAAHMEELMSLAKENKVSFLYEASVGGGIPLIKTLADSSRTNTFNELYGILNGTSNYILTKMAEEGLDFSQALQKAQEAGFAEEDPTDDIDGPDVARKVSVLTATILGKYLPVSKLPMSGIRYISKMDMDYASQIGCVIKLIGRVKIQANQIYASIEPEFIRKNSLVAQVKDEFNIGIAKGDFLREVSFYGEGAGKMATASAVVSDILDIQSANGEPVSYPVQIDFSDSEVSPFSVDYYLRFEHLSKERELSLLKESDVDFEVIDSLEHTYIIKDKDSRKMDLFSKSLEKEKIIFFKAKINVDFIR